MRKKSDLFIPDFGYHLKLAIASKGISQAEFSRQMGISYEHINHMCNDSKYPSLDLLIEMCKKLNVSADYLLDLED